MNLPSMGRPGDNSRDVRWCPVCPDLPSTAIEIVRRVCKCGRAMPCFGLPGGDRHSALWCARCPDKDPRAINVMMKR